METFTKEKIAACALNRIFGFEPRLGHALISYAGSAEAVFHLDKEEIRSAMGPYWKYINLIGNEALEQAEAELEGIHEDGSSFIAYNEDAYPSILKECDDPPIGLYFRSDDLPSQVFGRRPSVAVVGTRDMSQYGQDWCRRMVECMAKAPARPVVVSGLAFGIDITAHEAALDNGLPTIAVMATGIDAVYPHRHIHTADRMVSSAGCALVTDYPAGTSPLAIHFMRRNRIIAGLSESIILVESKVKGGGMITARLGSSYNRDIYALPGRIDDLRSQGCNMLIRDKIAEPAGSPEEMVERLGLGNMEPQRKKDVRSVISETYRGLSGDSLEEFVSVATAIRRRRGADIEEIKMMTGLKHGTVAGIIEMLASDGIISIDLLGHCSYI